MVLLLTSAYGKISQLLCKLSDDDDNETFPLSQFTYRDPQQLWLEDFHGYLNLKDQIAPGMSIVQ